MTEIDFNTDFKGLISDYCKPGFKALGFKKSGNNFYRHTEELVQTFNIQKNSFNSRDNLSFTGNIGFIEPETHFKLYEVSSLPKFPKCTDGIIQFRLGQLTDNRDYWYRLKPNINLKDVASKLERDIKTVQEYFESHMTLHSLEDLIADSAKIHPYWGEMGKFALLKKLGKDMEASSVISSVYAEAKKPKSWFTIRELVQGVWTEKKSKPEVNIHWLKRIEKVAALFNEKLN